MPRAKQKAAASGGRLEAGPGKLAKAKAKPRTAAAASKAKAKATPMVEIAESAPQASSGALLLPDCLDASAAAAVKDMLLARRGSALVVDASQVRRVGAQSLQILIAAARTWQADGQSYCVTNSSSELLDTIVLIGLSREDLMLEGTMQ
jgi:anti-anti-sigma regulatory factor